MQLSRNSSGVVCQRLWPCTLVLCLPVNYTTDWMNSCLVTAVFCNPPPCLDRTGESQGKSFNTTLTLSSTLEVKA